MLSSKPPSRNGAYFYGKGGKGGPTFKGRKGRGEGLFLTGGGRERCEERGNGKAGEGDSKSQSE